MESKKINQLATNVAPQTSDLTIIGDPITGVSKKITLLQIANLFATTGTVSSVAVTETGDALTITGSPITTAGTINIGFAGAATQYVRGDGALADFPTSTGGGSSVSYYLNSSVSQGTIGGNAYRQLSKTPIIGAGTDITISANGYVANYITDVNDPALLEVPGGNFNCEFYFSVNSNNHNPFFYAELYKYDGTTFTLLGSNQAIPDYLSNGTTLSAYYFAIPVATAALTITDRLAIRIYVNVDTKVVTLHTENNHLCQVVTTFSKGLTSLNNLTRQVQFLATGTSGTDFNISSSTATHTFNIPSASATNRGLITTGTQTIGGDKTLNGNTDFVGNSNFSGYAIFSNAIPTQINYGAKIAKGSIPATFGSDSVNLYSDATTNNIIFRDNLSIAKLLFNNSTQTFTFPAATGTIALTSDLSSYVPYTGATTNVDLGASNNLSANNITALGSLKSDFGLLLKSGLVTTVSGYLNISAQKISGNSQLNVYTDTGFSFSLSAPNNANYTYSFPSSSGTLALTSDLSAYLPLSGGTLTGALSGTSATFSGKIRWGTGTYEAGVSGIYNTSDDGTILVTKTGVSRDFLLSNGVGATVMTIPTGTTNVTFQGAATFSSSVTATGLSLATAGSTAATITSVGTNVYSSLSFVNSTTGYGYDIGFGGSASIAPNSFYVYGGSSASVKLAITSGGNVGILTSSPNSALQVGGFSGNNAISIGAATDGVSSLYFGDGTGAALYRGFIEYQHNGDFMRIGTSAVEAMRITSVGAFKATTDGTYLNSGAPYHELRQSNTDTNLAIFTNVSASPYGPSITFTSASPNNTANYFLIGTDSSVSRFIFYANGGLANYQANNVNLSDERTKKDIILLESYWDKFKAIEIVKFKYKDQTHDDFNIGVIAQQVEKVAPEFVDVDGWDNKPKLDDDGNEIVSNEEPLKSIYTADLHHATIKVLQECMAKIEEQQAQIKELKTMILAKN